MPEGSLNLGTITSPLCLMELPPWKLPGHQEPQPDSRAGGETGGEQGSQQPCGLSMGLCWVGACWEGALPNGICGRGCPASQASVRAPLAPAGCTSPEGLHPRPPPGTWVPATAMRRRTFPVPPPSGAEGARRGLLGLHFPPLGKQDIVRYPKSAMVSKKGLSLGNISP